MCYCVSSIRYIHHLQQFRDLIHIRRRHIRLTRQITFRVIGIRRDFE